MRPKQYEEGLRWDEAGKAFGVIVVTHDESVAGSSMLTAVVRAGHDIVHYRHTISPRPAYLVDRVLLKKLLRCT